MSCALVTVAGRCIGRAIAIHLAKAGADIVVHYNRSAEEAAEVAHAIEGMGSQAVLAEIDLARPKFVAQLIPSLAKELGSLAILVNNASLFEPDVKDPGGTLHHAINSEAPRILSDAFYAQVPEGETGVIFSLLDCTPPE